MFQHDGKDINNVKWLYSPEVFDIFVKTTTAHYYAINLIIEKKVLNYAHKTAPKKSLNQC